MYLDSRLDILYLYVSKLFRGPEGTTESLI